MDIRIESDNICLRYAIPFEGKLLVFTCKETIRADSDINAIGSRLIKKASLFIIRRYLKHRIETYRHIKHNEKLNYTIKLMRIADIAAAMDDKFFLEFIFYNEWQFIAPKRPNCWNDIIPQTFQFIQLHQTYFKYKILLS